MKDLFFVQVAVFGTNFVTVACDDADTEHGGFHDDDDAFDALVDLALDGVYGVNFRIVNGNGEIIAG